MSTSVKISRKKYNRAFNPYNHIEEFEAYMDAYNATDDANCKAFPITFEDVASNWFWSLATSFIKSFEDLRQVFLTNSYLIRSNT